MRLVGDPRAKGVEPLRAKAILSRNEARMDFAVSFRGRRRVEQERSGSRSLGS